jgi:epoxide hydrolase
MSEEAADIRPFRIDVPQSDLDDLRDRLRRTRLPEESPRAAWDQGVPRSYLAELLEYWADGYDWREWEARLNAVPQFTTTIDGQRIHFLHLRSAEPDAIPLVLTHGWPGSVAEFLEVIGPLADPAAYGGDPADAFHVVVPSLPGYGFSGPATEPGWNIRRIARAWAALMDRLGYARYAVQGGDWGSAVSRDLGVVDAGHVLGVHLNFLLTFPTGRPGELDGLTEAERGRLARLDHFLGDMSGYMKIQSTRPQTLAYGLADSPAGQLAWIVEKFKEWTDAARVPEDAVDRDHLLTNVMIYWLTNTAASSARLYYEFAHSGGRGETSTTPTGIAVFPAEIASPVRALAERSDNIVHWSEFERGGHFAAMEQPEALVGDIRAFFRRFRESPDSGSI